jgi:phage tail-like protein
MNNHQAISYPTTISRRHFLLGVAAVGGAGLFALTGLSTFKSIGGLTSEQEVLEYVETNRGETVLKKLPGKRTPPTVTLKRGMTRSAAGSNIEMASWHEAHRSGLKNGIQNATFTIFNLEDKPVARYYMENAWPQKLELGTLSAAGSEVEIETVTIVAERIQRVGV